MSVLAGPALLFCPADRPDRYEKAAARADVVIFDLEDAVGPEAKDEARRTLARALPAYSTNAVVRINQPGSPWFAADADMLRTVGHAAVMVPKVERRSDLDAVSDLEAVAICETAAGVVHSFDIASHGACRGLMWGSEDLIADLGGRRSRADDGSYYPLVEQARSTVRLAAAAAGKSALDTVSVDISDLETVRRDALAAVDLGFQGKACIHPDHVAVIREAFGVTDEQLEWAQGVVAMAAEKAGVFRYRGRMIDEPLIRHARHIVGNSKK